MMARVAGKAGDNPRDSGCSPSPCASPPLPLVAIVGPGIALQRLAGVAVDPALVLPLGIAATAGAYWLSLVVGVPWLFPVIVGGLLVSLLAVRRPLALAEGPSFRGAIAPAVATVALLAVTQYGGNRVARPASSCSTTSSPTTPPSTSASRAS